MNDERLIELVESHPCLYDKSNAFYKVSTRKENAWTEISEELSIGIEACQKRWRTLRERFAKESKKRKGQTGDKRDDVRPWAYYERLLFLRDFVSHRGTSDSFLLESQAEEAEEDERIDDGGEEGQGENEDDVVEDERTRVDEGTRGRRKRRKQSASNEVDLEIIRQLQKTERVDDENDLFGQSVGSSIRRLNPRKRALAKIRIQEVLYQIEFEEN
ncbi:transcription factor Adf-1-like isoform X1 [Oscarella lobularis]|uniref:transcription factor Adf-1-like isoform X1 n=1 Tax=Oscarella lobularis TaxID=121494 RepID=UPI0033132A96